jgi:hypothetical protein
MSVYPIGSVYPVTNVYPPPSRRQRYLISPSDNVLASADTERSTNSTSYVKLKEIQVYVFGKIRAYFELKTTGTGTYARVYRNGSPVGTERTPPSINTWYAYVEDIDGWKEGDFYQLYACDVWGGTVSVRNFRLCGSLQVGAEELPVAKVTLD